MDPLEILNQVLPDFPDADTLEYMSGILADSEAEDIRENLFDFIEDFAGSEEKANELINEISKLFLGETSSAKVAVVETDAPKKLQNTIVMAKNARKDEDAAKATAELLTGATQVNSNDEIITFLSEDQKAAVTEEDMMNAARKKKKAKKIEKKMLARERNVAPIRNAIMEGLTRKPVVIHGMVGEDGSYGGNPCVDIILNDINIDLAGISLIEDTNVTFVYARRYGLIGKNGSGKTTLLKHLAAKALPGIPWYLQILHISQEIDGNDVSALQTVLDTDVERSALLAQKAFLEGDAESFDVEATQELLKSVGVTLDSSTPPEERLCQIYERLEDIDADLAEKRASTILAGLSFTPEMMQEPTKNLSGGYYTAKQCLTLSLNAMICFSLFVTVRHSNTLPHQVDRCEQALSPLSHWQLHLPFLKRLECAAYFLGVFFSCM
eukprot:m.975741 g.975741  ORF g.975741 m.975741 type:complete len:439 (-) comp23942_c1_seq9:4728-6044(-)